MKWKKKILSLGVLVALVGSMAVSASENQFAGMEDYFFTEGAEVSVQEESVDFILTGETATVTFNKPLASDGFSLSFAGVDGNTMKQIDFILTDSSDEGSSAKLNFIRMNDTYTAVAFNDAKRSYITNGSLYLKNDTDFYFTYNAESQVFTDSSSYVISASSNIDGSAFTGFASQLVNLKMELHGEPGSVFSLKEINRQRMGSAYEVDSVEPIITVTNNITEVMKGSTITLPTAFATDVLADNATLTMCVYDTEGNIMKAADGTLLENVIPDTAYEIKIDSYGDYRIEYQATDGRNTTRAISSQIHVVDDSKPSMKLSEALPVEAKQNEELMLPELSYEDNVTAEENIVSWVTVMYPSGKIQGVKNAIILEEEGQYRFTFHAMDEEGNIRRIVQKIYVEGNSNEEE